MQNVANLVQIFEKKMFEKASMHISEKINRLKMGCKNMYILFFSENVLSSFAIRRKKQSKSNLQNKCTKMDIRIS